ncbi:MAG: hypothetical protein M3O62_05340 [Pseudomonadota bacterium]|nr:hypothetical protein [Pseudomonadota bacterium]
MIRNNPDVPLAEQREMLSRQLQVQRQQIGQELAPIAGTNSDYPRSMTMRLLIRRPVLVIRMLRWLAAVLKAR